MFILGDLYTCSSSIILWENTDTVLTLVGCVLKNKPFIILEFEKLNDLRSYIRVLTLDGKIGWAKILDSELKNLG